MSQQRWKVTLTMTQKLTHVVVADERATEETLTELALQAADDGDASWTTTYNRTRAQKLGQS
jgi:hypothetical protein